MAIDDLLYQSDPAQRRRRTPPPGSRPGGVQDPLARAAANRARIPTGGISEGVSFGDSAARTAAAAQPTAAAPAAPGRLAGARKLVNGAAGKLVGGVAAVQAVGDAMADDSTDRYAQRFAVDPPTGDGSLGDIGKFALLRAGGFASDVGNNLLAGVPGKTIFRDRAAAAPAAITRAPAAAAQAPRAPVPAAEQSIAELPTVYRRGQTFSDQPIAGGVEYTPKSKLSGGAEPSDIQDQYRRASAAYAGIADLNATGPAQAARDREGSMRNAAALRQIVAGNKVDQMLREAKIDAGSLLNTRGFQPRGSGAARQARVDRLQEAAIDIATGIPEKEFYTSTRDEAQIGQSEAQAQLAGQQGRLTEQQAKLAEQQGIAAGIGNEQALGQQEVLGQLSALSGSAPASQRRALIDRALVGAGKDPDAGRFMSIDSLSPDGITLKTAFDTRTGQVVGGGAGGGKPQKPGGFEQFLSQFRQDPRANAYSDADIKKFYSEKYGNQ